MPNGIPWTSEEVVTLLTFWGTEPFKETVKRIGRSEAACRSKRQRIRYDPNVPRRTYKPWTAKEVKILSNYWGSEDPDKTAARLGRSHHSVYQKVRELKGTSVIKDRYTTQKELEEILGHKGPHRIPGLMKNIKLRKWGRTWLLTDDQVETIKTRYRKYLNELAQRERPWSEQFLACRGCGTSSQEGTEAHRAQGLCKRCYARAWWRYSRGHDIGIEGIIF
jgi:hypothetical protein